MPKVICMLPNASSLISGVRFEQREAGGVISEEVADDVADRFMLIPGYSMAPAPAPVQPPAAPAAAEVPSQPTPVLAPEPAQLPTTEVPAAPAPAPEPAPSREAAEIENLRTELTSRGVKVNGRWGLDRLKSELAALGNQAPAPDEQF